MSKRFVVLGDGGRVGLGAYVHAWRRVRAAPPTMQFSRSLCDRWPCEAKEALEQFRDGLQQRINRHLPWYGKGRKWDDDWQRATAYAARDINTPRLIIHWLPRDLLDRFADRLRGIECET